MEGTNHFDLLGSSALGFDSSAFRPFVDDVETGIY